MRLGTEHLAAFIEMLKQDRAKLLEELTQEMPADKTAFLRGRIAQIDDIVRLYPNRIKEQ